ncbi:MAG: carbamoyltransferase C-terminal domain-containing protein [Candidatus Micrarchaeaceae archaeon]
MFSIGIHDLHDSGAGVVENGEVLGAVNEERFTKRKNDVGFPENAIKYLVWKGREEEIAKVAIPWISGSALFARIFPEYERRRRSLWRKEAKKPSRMQMHLTNLAFKLIQDQKPDRLWKFAGTAIGGNIIRRRLAHLGIEKELVFVDHHTAHASGAYYASGFKEALVITLDGAGDGLCGTVSIGENGKLTRINKFRAGASLGILYGAATLACDMRYGEDEGKLMSLAAYSYPKGIKELESISRYDTKSRQLVSGCGIKYEFLLAEYMKDNILWKNDREGFAYAIQKHVGDQVLKIVRQHVAETGIHNVAVAGGFFSNIITNMLINELEEVKNFFVFPHMGDGGLALGAAYYADFEENLRFNKKQVDSIYYGPGYTEKEVERAIRKHKGSKKLEIEEVGDIEKLTAEKLAENEIVLRFQGRMEYGPRSLGNRSVLALPENSENRDKINLIIKKRPYYQPFASTILEEDAKSMLDPYVRPNRFMTVGYRTTELGFEKLKAASHIDKTTRPQILGEENARYRALLKHIRKKTGVGAVLNTSLNKHGMPIAMDPEDAIWTLFNTGAENLAIGNFFVHKVVK